jgi:hypothetical protein
MAVPAAVAPTVPSSGELEHVQLEPAAVPQRVRTVDVPTEFPASRAAPLAPERAPDMAADSHSKVAPAAKGSRLPWLLGGVALAAVAGAVAFWPRAPEPAAPAAPVPAPAASIVVVAPPPAASVPEVPVAASAAASQASAEVPAIVVPPSEPVKTVEVPARTSAKPAAPAAAKPSSKPEPKPEVKPRPEPAPAAPAPVPESTTPGPSCGPREGIRYHVCMERECSRPDFAGHSACLRWKQDAKRD